MQKIPLIYNYPLQENRMKRKLLSLLLCTAMLISALPVTSLADGTATSAGAKLGVANGDTVLFAGKGGTPIKWRVADSAKSNTGNANGMLLLSESTYDATPSASVDWSYDVCNSFYSTYFGNLYKDAVMTVSKTDDNYTDKSNNNVFEGKLPSGTTVFALSADELKALPDAIKKFPGQSNWWLRSVCTKGTIMPLLYYSYANANTGDFASIQSSAAKKNEVKLRPAVNLSKDKLASIDGKILLLPTGSFTDGELSPVGTASEWKLSVKTDDSDSGLEKAISINNTESGFTLQVQTTQQIYNNPYSKDYVGVIIMKSNGTITHYGRYLLTGSSTSHNFSVTLPSDVDINSDKMYAFYENYQGELSGAISTPIAICLKHNYKYEHSSGNYHQVTCKNCDFQTSEQHNFGEYSYTDINHSRTCSVCSFVKTENHKLTYTQKDTKTHSASCGCGYKADNLEHTYAAKISDVPEIFTCSDCKAIHFTAINGVIGGMPERNEYKAGTATLNGQTFASADNVFSENDAVGTVNTDSTGKAVLTFDTKRPVRAEGFKIKLPKTATANLPKTISLYGKNAQTGAYEEIETAALRSIIDGETASGEYSFFFSAKYEFSAYDSFKAEMDFGTAASANIVHFTLLSEASTAAISLNLRGIIATDAPDVMYPGEDYVASFISGTGYPKSLSVRKDNQILDGDGWTYSAETGILKILSQYINAGSVYEIYRYIDDPVTVKLESTSLALENINREAVFGEEYVAEFRVASGKTELAPKSMNDITVTNKNGDITHLCTLDSEGKLHIPGELLVGGIGDSVTIYAEESGRKLTQENAAVKVTRNGDYDRYFANIDDAKTVIELDGDADITILKDTDADAVITLSGKAVNVDLGGHTVTAKTANGIFDIKGNSQVSISNGTFAANDAETVIHISESSTLTLGNVITPQNEQSIFVKFPSKLILDGAKSDATVYLDDGTFEQKDGTSRLTSEKSLVNNVKLYGGTVAKCNIGQADMFTLIDDGYVFELSDAKYFDDFVRSVLTDISFSVKKAEIITAQPRDIKVNLGESARLTAGAPNVSAYYWYDPDNVAICKSSTDYAEIGADARPGEYSYRCAVLTGNTVSGSRIAKVTVVCPHSNVTDGVCDVCCKNVAAQVTAGGKTQVFESIDSAIDFANANENTAIKLLSDVTIDAAVYFTGKNTTLDMNGKTFASTDVNKFITVNDGCSLTVTGSGNMTARVLAEGNGSVTVENGTFKEVSCQNEGTITVNGGTFALLGAAGGKIAVNDGTFTQLTATGGTTVLNGGTFAKLTANEGTTLLNGGTFDEISGRYFYKLLAKGKAFFGVNYNMFNTGIYEYNEGTVIQNVKVTDAPFVITKQPKGGFVAEGTQDATVSVEVEENEAYKGKITYKWYHGTLDYEGKFEQSKDAPETGATVAIDTMNIVSGTQKTYFCAVSYEGYEIKSDLATFTIGRGTPIAHFEDGYINSHGNDCLLVAAAYNGSELLATYTMELSKDVAFIDINLALDPLFEKIDDDVDVDKIKIFFWDNLNDMTPLGIVAELEVSE